ncbi:MULTISPECIES: hypothetical protein [Streptomyces]|uniref:hypothetical protein n=1 Tax=Streptomyces sp. H-KF8 TaxID=1727216 RepID=UPI000A5F2A8E|nr:hypothetical protein [Streptomyces sp. H-KF8]
MTHDKRLGELLREEADAFPVGPAPVDDVLHRGRRGARRRRRATAAGAVTTVTALLAFGAAHLTPAVTSAPAVTPAPAPPATAVPHPTAPEESWPPPRTVDPYEPVPIGHGLSAALLPDGRQNHVVGPGDIGASVEQAREHLGDGIRPDTFSSGTYAAEDDHVLFYGAFRTDTPPAGIGIALDSGPRHTAMVLNLPGDPGWGTYHAFGDTSAAADTGFTVTAYAEDGGVLFEQRFGGPPPPPD